MKKTTSRYLQLFLVFVVMISASVSCGARDVSSAYCVAEMTQFDEVVNNDNAITWPGQRVPELSTAGYYRLYIPCNYRNYVISNGKITNPNGTTLGDRTEPILLALPSGKIVETYASAYWTLNQGEAELKQFIKFSKKYNALSNDMSGSGNVYSSTPGWNDMLLENFSPTMDSIARQAMINIVKNPPADSDGNPVIINDDIWKVKDTRQWEALANEMSRLFADNIASRVGTELDLFCGSNTSTGWENPDPSLAGKPGNKFNCSDVIIEVTDVTPAVEQVDTGSQSVIETNQQRYDAAKELYGDQTECWLGIQDAIKACGNTPNCTVILESNQCQNPDGSDAGGTIIQLTSPAPVTTQPTEATQTP